MFPSASTANRCCAGGAGGAVEPAICWYTGCGGGGGGGGGTLLASKFPLKSTVNLSLFGPTAVVSDGSGLLSTLGIEAASEG
jgi:hypothetical protein